MFTYEIIMLIPLEGKEMIKSNHYQNYYKLNKINMFVKFIHLKALMENYIFIYEKQMIIK